MPRTLRPLPRLAYRRNVQVEADEDKVAEHDFVDVVQDRAAGHDVQVLVAYTPGHWDTLSTPLLEQLRELGFQLPQSRKQFSSPKLLDDCLPSVLRDEALEVGNFMAPTTLPVRRDGLDGHHFVCFCHDRRELKSSKRR